MYKRYYLFTRSKGKALWVSFRGGFNLCICKLSKILRPTGFEDEPMTKNPSSLTGTPHCLAWSLMEE